MPIILPIHEQPCKICEYAIMLNHKVYKTFSFLVQDKHISDIDKYKILEYICTEWPETDVEIAMVLSGSK